MSFNQDKSQTLTLSLQNNRLANNPIYFLNKPLEDVKSLKCLDLTISHDLSWADHIFKMASPARDWASFVVKGLSLANLKF